MEIRRSTKVLKDAIRAAPLPFVSDYLSLLNIFLRNDLRMQEKFYCLRFYLDAFGKDALLATLPRSGLNYVSLVIDLAIDIAQGGEGKYDYDERERTWRTSHSGVLSPFDWRSPLQRRDYIQSASSHVIFHTHQPFSNVVSFKKQRMKTVVMVRNVFDQLKSFFFFQLTQDSYTVSSKEEFLNSGSVDQYIDYCNSWGKLAGKRPQNYCVVRYEDLSESPLEVFHHMSKFWDLELPRSSLKSAIGKSTRDEMSKRIPRSEWNSNPRVTLQKREGVFSRHDVNAIRNKIKDKLEYDFGYDYGEELRLEKAPGLFTSTKELGSSVNTRAL